MTDSKSNFFKLILIILLPLLLLLLLPTAYKIILFLASEKPNYLPEKFNSLELLYSRKSSDASHSFFYAYRLDKNIADRIKKEGITYLREDNRSYGKCELSRYDCKWKTTPIDETMRAYKGLERALARTLDVNIWLEMEGKNGYYFTVEDRTIAIVVLPKLSLLLYVIAY